MPSGGPRADAGVASLRTLHAQDVHEPDRNETQTTKPSTREQFRSAKPITAAAGQEDGTVNGGAGCRTSRWPGAAPPGALRRLRVGAWKTR